MVRGNLATSPVRLSTTSPVNFSRGRDRDNPANINPDRRQVSRDSITPERRQVSPVNITRGHRPPGPSPDSTSPGPRLQGNREHTNPGLRPQDSRGNINPERPQVNRGSITPERLLHKNRGRDAKHLSRNIAKPRKNPAR
jgi:hypothetical protein